MNIEIVNKEVKSKALQELSTELEDIFTQIKAKEISIKQGVAQITCVKHIIQVVSLDWQFNKRT